MRLLERFPPRKRMSHGDHPGPLCVLKHLGWFHTSVQLHPQSMSSLLTLACGWTLGPVAQLRRNSRPNSFCRITALAEGTGRRVVSAEGWRQCLTLSLPFHLALWPPFKLLCLVWAAPAPLLRPSSPCALGKISTLSWMLQAETTDLSRYSGAKIWGNHMSS